ncbi:MAG: DUF1990 family protein [Candidatus Tumulicola sp.]
MPPGFVHDRSCVQIGRGAPALAVAREAFLRWRQFDIEWVAVVDPAAAIADGQVVGVEAHTAGLWSLNVCRILETVDTANRFGFCMKPRPHMSRMAKSGSLSNSIQ